MTNEVFCLFLFSCFSVMDFCVLFVCSPIVVAVGDTFNCLIFGRLGSLQMDSYVLLITSLLSVTRNLRFVLYISCLRLGIRCLFRKPWFLQARNGF